jgi:hypothetical protein
MRNDRAIDEKSDDDEFLPALRKGVLIGAGLLVLVLPLRMVQQHRQAEHAQPLPPVATAPAQPPIAAPAQPGPQRQAQAPQAAPLPEQHAAAPAPLPRLHLADFGKADPSPDVRLVANWVTHTRNAEGRSFVVIDKKFARVYVFDPQGRLKADSPALMGEYPGDDSSPGVGDKPLWQLKPWEKTTPAGRFVAEPGINSHHQDVVWVSYDLAVSMHRVIKGLPKEHRAARLASATYKDNRISNGCINLPVPFYEKVLAPTVRATGAVIYVIPEKKSIEKVLGAFDVTSAQQVALKQ